MTIESYKPKLVDTLKYSIKIIRNTLIILTSAILLSACDSAPAKTSLIPLDITGKAVSKSAQYYQSLFRDPKTEKIYFGIDNVISGSYHYAGSVFAVEEFQYPPREILPSPGLPVAVNMGADAIPTVIFESGGNYTACEYSNPGWDRYSIYYNGGECKPFNLPPQLPQGSVLISINTGQNVAATSYYRLPNGDIWKNLS